MTGAAGTFKLSEAQHAAWTEMGFVELPQLFSAGEVQEISDAMDRLYAMAAGLVESGEVAAAGGSVVHGGAKFTYQARPDGSGFDVRHVANCGAAEPVLDRYGRDERLLVIAAALLGSQQMNQLINQAHFKKPGTGVAFDWHQDSTHRGIDRGGFVDVNGRGSYVQIALALDDVTAESGPLSFIPGSHRAGHLGLTPADVGVRFDPSTAVRPLLKRGDAVAFSPYVIHGSEPNHSTTPRRTFINGFAYPGANQRPPGLPGFARLLTAPSHV